MNRNQTETQRAILRSAPWALVGALGLLGPACSSDTSSGPVTSPDAGGGGAASGAGGKTGSGAGGKSGGGVTGSGGSSSGGAGGTASGGASGSGGQRTDASTGGATSADGGDASLPPLAPLSGTLLVAAADFTAGVGEIATVDLSTGHLVSHVNVADGDIALTVSGGRAFAMERSGGAVDALSATGTIDRHIPLSLGDGGASYLNPHDVLLVAGSSKAYVPLYSTGAIAVVDVDSGAQTGAISLAAFLDPSDHDGSADPDSVYYDAATHRAYFLLSRIDVYSGSLATSYTPLCPPVSPLIIAVDTTTDSIVDLNGDGGGLGIPLPLVGPSAWTATDASGQLFVVGSGCAVTADGGFTRTHHGVAKVNLGARTAELVYAATSQDFLGTLLPLGDSTYALATSDANFTTTLRRFDPAAPSTLGAALAGAPDSAIVGGSGTLLGLQFGHSADGSVEQEVTRYDVATGRIGNVAAFQWAHAFSFATMAWVK